MKYFTFICIITICFNIISCGGSSSSDSMNNASQNEDKIEEWTNFNIFPDYENNNDGIGIVKNIYTIIDGKIYYKEKNSTIHLFYKPTIYVTKDSIYHDGPIDTKYGTLQGYIEQNPNQWIIKPYSKLSSATLEFTKKFKLIDLEGVSVLTVLDAMDYINTRESMPEVIQSEKYKEILQTMKNTYFSKGAKCLLITQSDNNMENIQFFSNESKGNTPPNEWINLKESQDSSIFYKNYLFVQGYFKDYMNNTNYHYGQQYGIVFFENNFYLANFFKLGTEYTRDEEVRQMSNSYFTSGWETEHKQQYLEAKMNQCNYYNETASNTVSNIFKF